MALDNEDMRRLVMEGDDTDSESDDDMQALVGRDEVFQVIDNEEKAMELASGDEWSPFHQLSSRLKGDRAFMERAVAVNDEMLECASPSLQKNMDLVVRAVASSGSFRVLHAVGVTMEEVGKYVIHQFDLVETFQLALHGISLSKQSPLHLLNCGVETSQGLKMLIAQYVGVSIGDSLERLRRVDALLKQDNEDLTRRTYTLVGLRVMGMLSVVRTLVRLLHSSDMRIFAVIAPVQEAES